jgi:hypothetical protein
MMVIFYNEVVCVCYMTTVLWRWMMTVENDEKTLPQPRM